MLQCSQTERLLSNEEKEVLTATLHSSSRAGDVAVTVLQIQSLKDVIIANLMNFLMEHYMAQPTNPNSEVPCARRQLSAVPHGVSGCLSREGDYVSPASKSCHNAPATLSVATSSVVREQMETAEARTALQPRYDSPDAEQCSAGDGPVVKQELSLGHAGDAESSGSSGGCWGAAGNSCAVGSQDRWQGGQRAAEAMRRQGIGNENSDAYVAWRSGVRMRPPSRHVLSSVAHGSRRRSCLTPTHRRLLIPDKDVAAFGSTGPDLASHSATAVCSPLLPRHIAHRKRSWLLSPASITARRCKTAGCGRVHADRSKSEVGTSRSNANHASTSNHAGTTAALSYSLADAAISPGHQVSVVGAGRDRLDDAPHEAVPEAIEVVRSSDNETADKYSGLALRAPDDSGSGAVDPDCASDESANATSMARSSGNGTAPEQTTWRPQRSAAAPTQPFVVMPGPLPSYACLLCGRRFNDKSNLSKHFKTVHLQLKPYECMWCSSKFSTSWNLRCHANRCRSRCFPVASPGAVSNSTGSTTPAAS